jgi:histidyl-tRNA synthetase
MSDEALARIDQLLQIQQQHHLDLAALVEEYRRMVFEADDEGAEVLFKTASIMPGGRYHVLTTHLRETWLVLQADLVQLFPDLAPPPKGGTGD